MQSAVHYFQRHVSIQSPGEITWAHAANSQARLRAALNDPQILMIEVDIRRAWNGEIIAAHPPALTSDLSFCELLQFVAASWQGLKLDFKSPEVVDPCLDILRQSNLRQPILLNADILRGDQASASRFKVDDFITRCQAVYPQGILSIGWTLRDGRAGSYSQSNIEAMLALCQKYALEQVTFPVKASFLPSSWQYVRRLLAKEGYTLTLWGEADQRTWNWVREYTDPLVTCYDCFDEQRCSRKF